MADLEAQLGRAHRSRAALVGGSHRRRLHARRGADGHAARARRRGAARNDRRGRRGAAARRRARRPGHGARAAAPACRARATPARRRHRRLVRAHERDPRDRHREPRRGRAAGRDARRSSTRRTAPHGLVYPVFPGEYSASLGGNVATNAGGMRAVKYGVTRHHVLGLEAVLATGEVIRTGGKFVKTSTGYDLTQLIIGSEGTLALVTEVTLKLYPAAAAPGDRARAVRDARRGHRGGAADRRQRRRPADPRVHRPAHDGGDDRARRLRPRRPDDDQGQPRSPTSSS